MEPSVVVIDSGLDAVRRRRVSLRAAMRRLEDAIATPLTDHAEPWCVRVQQAAVEVQSQLREHIVATEGPQGFHAEILTAAPRLSHAVSMLAEDHVVAARLVDRLVGRSVSALTDEHAIAVRDTAAELIARLNRHRQRGADLIYEAYEYDIGGED